MLTPSLFPIPRREKFSCFTGCNTCDICKNYMFFSSTVVCTVIGKKYYIRGNFTCNSINVIYLVERVNGECQYVGSNTSFKQLFRIHKSDIKTKKDRCETTRHLNYVSCHPINPHGYLKVQLIKQASFYSHRNFFPNSYLIYQFIIINNGTNKKSVGKLVKR